MNGSVMHVEGKKSVEKERNYVDSSGELGAPVWGGSEAARELEPDTFPRPDSRTGWPDCPEHPDRFHTSVSHASR